MKKLLKQASSILAALIFMGISAYTAKKQKQPQQQHSSPAMTVQQEQKEIDAPVVRSSSSQEQADSQKKSVKTNTAGKNAITEKQTQAPQSAALPATQPQKGIDTPKEQAQQDVNAHRPAVKDAPDGWTTIPPPDFTPKSKWHRSNLERHWDKHQAEFPEFHNEQEYGAAALYFFEHPPKGTLTKTNGDGDRMFYHQDSNTFGVLTSDGTAKTMFRPSAGINYWRRQ